MKYTITTPPASVPVTRKQFAEHLRLSNFDKADYLDATVADAVDYVQSETESSLATQSLTVTHYRTGNRLLLPRGPVQSIISVTANGVTLSPSAYVLGASGNYDYIAITSAPQPPIVVTYVAGYSTIPNDLRRALLMVAANFYKYPAALPGTSAIVDFGLQRMLDKYRRTTQVR